MTYECKTPAVFLFAINKPTQFKINKKLSAQKYKTIEG